MVRERTGHPPSYAETKKMKSLTLHTHDCHRASLRDYSSSDISHHSKKRLNQRPVASQVVTFTAIRLRGSGFKLRPGQKFENENFCFRRTPAVVKACHPCRVRLIKMPLYKT